MKLSSIKNLAAALIMTASTVALAKGANAEAVSKAQQSGKGNVLLQNTYNFQVTVPEVGLGTLLSPNSTPRYFPQSRYIDLEAQCSSAVSALEEAISEAGLAYAAGATDDAAKIIATALRTSASGFGMSYYGHANPASIMALRHGAMLAEVMMSNVESFRVILDPVYPGEVQNMNGTTSALKLALVRKVAQLVINTFNELDTPHFFRRIQNCFNSHCYRDGARYLDIFDGDFFAETGKVAAKFITIYSDNVKIQAHNALELAIASQAAWSAAEILSTSVYRRDYACAVTRLSRLNTWIGNAIQKYMSMPEGIAREQYLIGTVGNTRAQMHWALNQVNLANCSLK